MGGLAATAEYRDRIKKRKNSTVKLKAFRLTSGCLIIAHRIKATDLHDRIKFSKMDSLYTRHVVLGTCTCTRVVLEYKFEVLVLVLVLEVSVLVLVLVLETWVLVLVLVLEA